MKRTGPAVRTSCIPCGHVYGRSCLEKWLTQCRNRSAKCPQCGKRFKHKDIINLYAQEVAIPNSDLEKKISYLREEIGSLKKKVVRHDKMFDESTKRQNDGVSSKRQKLAEHSYEPANLEPSTPAKIILAYRNYGQMYDLYLRASYYLMARWKLLDDKIFCRLEMISLGSTLRNAADPLFVYWYLVASGYNIHKLGR